MTKAPTAKRQKQLKKIIEKFPVIKDLEIKKDSIDLVSNWEEYLAIEKNYKKETFKFVCMCIKYRLTYKEIGDMLNITKAAIYKIYRYGLNGYLTESERKYFRELDNNRCSICFREQTDDLSLHIHHINSPKIKRASNLICLCPSCHRKVDSLKRKLDKKVINKRSDIKSLQL